MKVYVKSIDHTDEEQLIIKCHKVDEKIQDIINFVKSTGTVLPAYHMEKRELLIFIISVCLIYFAVIFFGWLLDQKDTRKINHALKIMQNRN